MNFDISEETVETTLTFDPPNRYPDGYHREVIAAGSLRAGQRWIRIRYEEEDEFLRVLHIYFDDSTRRAQFEETYQMTDGIMDRNGQSRNQFIRDHFGSDPEVSLTEEFEDMVSGVSDSV